MEPSGGAAALRAHARGGLTRPRLRPPPPPRSGAGPRALPHPHPPPRARARAGRGPGAGSGRGRGGQRAACATRQQAAAVPGGRAKGGWPGPWGAQPWQMSWTWEQGEVNGGDWIFGRVRPFVAPSCLKVFLKSTSGVFLSSQHGNLNRSWERWWQDTQLAGKLQVAQTLATNVTEDFGILRVESCEVFGQGARIKLGKAVPSSTSHQVAECQGWKDKYLEIHLSKRLRHQNKLYVPNYAHILNVML